MKLERTRAERTERLDEGTLHVFSLDEYAHKLREESAYAANGRDGITLVKSPTLRVVVEVLRAGVGMAEHRAPGPITVQVLAGEIRFTAGEETFRVRAGEALALPAGRPHAVEAVRDSTLLITLAPASGPEAASR